MNTTLWKKSACILCESNCGLEVSVQGRELVKFRGDKEHPGSAGYACEKPHRLNLYQNDRNRLRKPLRRAADGLFEEVEWDVAVAEIADRLRAVRERHGGDKIFFYGGGGQGNHLGGSYATALMGAVGAKHRSNALAQEKTGEAWVDSQLYGGHTKGDFEHAEVALFVGKNPWQSHSFPRARVTLKEIADDPARTLIVIDPRRSETAAMANIHVQLKPGTDAWCLAAIAAILVQERLLNHDFLGAHTVGAAQVLRVLAKIPVSSFAGICGVPEQTLRQVARRIGTARNGVAVYEDLGLQQGPQSTLSSYLNKLLWILTGNFARPGSMFLHTWFVDLGQPTPNQWTAPAVPRGGVAALVRRAGLELARRALSLGGAAIRNGVPLLAESSATRAWMQRGAKVLTSARSLQARDEWKTTKRRVGRSPVTGARVIGGLIPANSIADEILTDHPERFRAMWIDSSNPAHSLAESQRFKKALAALELVVVVDVAMTETARCAHYVLPASSQFEKYECTFFNVEFPSNVFHLRAPLVEALPGTLGEPEIYARIIRALGVVEERVLNQLRVSARASRSVFALTFFGALAAQPHLIGVAPYLLYEALGPSLPEGAAAAAVLWGLAHQCAIRYPESVRRAGFDGTGLEPGEKLFDAIIEDGRGVVFTSDRWEDVWSLVERADRRITVAIPELLDAIGQLPETRATWTSPEFPFVLAAGERRSFTANTIIRDPSWRKKDTHGSLRMSPVDAERMQIASGDRVRVVTEGGAAEVAVEVNAMMQSGSLSLPNGFGVDVPGASDASLSRTGVAANELTSARYRDWLAGTPWHKHVPARVERLL